MRPVRAKAPLGRATSSIVLVSPCVGMVTVVHVYGEASGECLSVEGNGSRDRDCRLRLDVSGDTADGKGRVLLYKCTQERDV